MRTARDEFGQLKKQYLLHKAKEQNQQDQAGSTSAKSESQSLDDAQSAAPSSSSQNFDPTATTPVDARSGDVSVDTTADDGTSSAEKPVAQRKHPWDYVDELTGLLKTAFPLLALSMETMVEQITTRMRPTTDEDMYRLIVACLNDAISVWVSRAL